MGRVRRDGRGGGVGGGGGGTPIHYQNPLGWVAFHHIPTQWILRRLWHLFCGIFWGFSSIFVVPFHT